MSKKHIAFFTNTYLPTMSGVVRSIETFRDAFSEMGHNVFIFAQKSQDYEDDEPFIFRYPAVEFPFANDYALPMPFSRTIDNLLPSLKLDVIHSHHPFLLGDVAADKAKSLSVPMVFTFHTRYNEYAQYVPINIDFTKSMVDLWISHYLEKCHHIITPSDSIKKILIESGVQGEITTIPTGIDIRPFKEADGQPIREKYGWADDLILISVGRLAKEKSFDTLLEAAARVMQERSHVRLVIIGGGMEKNNLIKLAEKLGIADRVLFTGSVPYEKVPNYLSAADIFCFASTSETQGLVTMEAMAAGLPIVAVDATGTSDAVEHGKEGLLTENSAQALAQAMQEVIDNQELRQNLIEGAKKKVDWFDIRIQAKRTLEVYDQAEETMKSGQHIMTHKKKQ